MKRYLQRLTLIVMGICVIASPAFAQQWDFEEGMDGWSVSGGEAVIIDSLAYSGSSAVLVTAGNSTVETNFQNTSTTQIAAGDTVRFHVYVFKSDTAEINGYQIFAQHGDGWTWEAKWINKEDLEVNAWNEVDYVIPEDAGALQSLGFQLSGLTNEGTPSVVIDKIEKVGAKPSISGQWSFEDGELGGWAGNGGTAEVVDTMGFDGTHSVKLTSANSTTETFLQNDVYTELAEGDTLRYAVYVPASDTAGINGFQTYIQHGSGWTWSAQWVNLSDMKPDAWNKVEFVIPALDGEVQIFGFQVLSREATDTPSVFIDLISKHPYPEQGPALGAPSALVLDTVGTTMASLSWTAAVGSDVQGYVVHRSIESDFTPAAETVVDTTSASSYLDTGLTSKTHYYYKVVAFDSEGNVSEPSNELSVATKAFDHYTTWDFESGELGSWSANDDAANDIGGSISVVDTTAFSGHYAIKVVKAADRPKVHVKTESAGDLIAGQTMYYRVYLPEDVSAIDSFQPFFQYNSWAGWDGESIMAADLEAGAWNTLSIKVPDAKPFDRMGLEIKYSADEGPAILVDLITTDPTEKGIPDMPAPTNLSRGIFSNTSVNLSWDPVEGAAGYKVYQSTEEGASLEDMKVAGSTGASKTTLLVSPLYSETTYYFKVTAKDDAGRETMSSDELKFKTSAFSSHQYWDFEDSEDVVFNTSPSNSATGTIERTDSMAYSGIYSLKVSTGATETFVVLDAPEFPATSIGLVAPGRWLRFNIWVSAEDTAGLMAFTPYYQDGNWGWKDAWYDISSIQADQWNTLEIFIPNNTDGLNRIGLDIRGKDGNPNADIFIDMVTTDPYPKLIWSAGAPTDLSATTTEDNSVELSWATPSEDAVKYNVYRGGEDAQSMSDMKLIGSSTTTTYTDAPEEDGTYNYAVTALDAEGRETEASAWVNVIYTPLEKIVGVPNSFELGDNYPNPFNPTTQIRYQVAKTSIVTIKVYNITGRLVQTLVNETRTPGSYTVSFRASNLSSGIYLYRMQAGSFSRVKQMMLIK